MELDRLVVDLAGAALGQDSLEGGERVGGVLRIRQAVDGGDDVVRLERLAGVVLDAAAQFEGPHGAVLVVRPAFGQTRLQREIGLGHAQELADLDQHGQAALVRDADRVDGACRGHRGHPDRRTGLGSLRAGLAGVGDQADTSRETAEQGQRQPQHAPVAHEGAAVDGPADQLVHEIVLEFAEAAPEPAIQVRNLSHRLPVLIETAPQGWPWLTRFAESRPSGREAHPTGNSIGAFRRTPGPPLRSGFGRDVSVQRVSGQASGRRAAALADFGKGGV